MCAGNSKERLARCCGVANKKDFSGHTGKSVVKERKIPCSTKQEKCSVSLLTTIVCVGSILLPVILHSLA
jgi:hypothetical protein